ncbi:sulfite exporter TauE/SafE family protein [Paracoccus aerodenitrificans]|uniref:sulfite exporter TauE/SafE family protein n=1 Tax=Paracoccus aerodenitrificans TaxID=3017781 RepID=UPI0022F05535|nr:sulfite exporter TauE/SafE family protein [Paracoccus aerodenitrificans]WBU63098.1 sulfite exporter TauE/SafE family protein [Paracoccus aerodenitrificans]
MELTQTSWVLAVLGAVAVGMAKGGLSMMSMISVPIMALTMSPVVAAGILLPVYVISDIGGLIAFRRAFDWPTLITLLPGAVAGIALGWATAHAVDDAAIMLIIGLIGAVFALNALIRPQMGGARGPRWGAGSFWGALAGYTSFVSHSGVPPYQIYVQPMQMQSRVFAGTTTVFFTIVNAVKLIPYYFLGQLNPANLRISAMLILPALGGLMLGLWLLRVIPQALFYKIITWALLLISLRLIWTGWVGL